MTVVASRIERLEQTVSLTVKYRTLLVDPPYRYSQTLAGEKARGGVSYPTMTIKEIQALPVWRWMDKDAQCWLWATNSHLHDALHVLDSWGFRYVTMATWVKTGFGLGYWLRGQTEHLIFGVQGSPRSKMIGPHGAIGTSWSTLIQAPRGEHSEKPEAAYDMIEEMSEEPRLELFARRRRSGWDCWGNELGISI